MGKPRQGNKKCVRYTCHTALSRGIPSRIQVKSLPRPCSFFVWPRSLDTNGLRIHSVAEVPVVCYFLGKEMLHDTKSVRELQMTCCINNRFIRSFMRQKLTPLVSALMIVQLNLFPDPG
jgi:hypothetical protein